MCVVKSRWWRVKWKTWYIKLINSIYNTHSFFVSSSLHITFHLNQKHLVQRLQQFVVCFCFSFHFIFIDITVKWVFSVTVLFVCQFLFLYTSLNTGKKITKCYMHVCGGIVDVKYSKVSTSARSAILKSSSSSLSWIIWPYICNSTNTLSDKTVWLRAIASFFFHSFFLFFTSFLFIQFIIYLADYNKK